MALGKLLTRLLRGVHFDPGVYDRNLNNGSFDAIMRQHAMADYVSEFPGLNLQTERLGAAVAGTQASIAHYTGERDAFAALPSRTAFEQGLTSLVRSFLPADSADTATVVNDYLGSASLSAQTEAEFQAGVVGVYERIINARNQRLQTEQAAHTLARDTLDETVTHMREVATSTVDLSAYDGIAKTDLLLRPEVQRAIQPGRFRRGRIADTYGIQRNSKYRESVENLTYDQKISLLREEKVRKALKGYTSQFGTDPIGYVTRFGNSGLLSRQPAIFEAMSQSEFLGDSLMAVGLTRPDGSGNLVPDYIAYLNEVGRKLEMPYISSLTVEVGAPDRMAELIQRIAPSAPAPLPYLGAYIQRR